MMKSSFVSRMEYTFKVENFLVNVDTGHGRFNNNFEAVEPEVRY